MNLFDPRHKNGNLIYFWSSKHESEGKKCSMKMLNEGEKPNKEYYVT